MSTPKLRPGAKPKSELGPRQSVGILLTTEQDKLWARVLDKHSSPARRYSRMQSCIDAIARVEAGYTHELLEVSPGRKHIVVRVPPETRNSWVGLCEASKKSLAQVLELGLHALDA